MSPRHTRDVADAVHGEDRGEQSFFLAVQCNGVVVRNIPRAIPVSSRVGASRSKTMSKSALSNMMAVT